MTYLLLFPPALLGTLWLLQGWRRLLRSVPQRNDDFSFH